MDRIRKQTLPINKWIVRNEGCTARTGQYPGTPAKIIAQAALDAYEAYHSNLSKLKKLTAAQRRKFGAKKRGFKNKKNRKKAERKRFVTKRPRRKFRPPKNKRRRIKKRPHPFSVNFKDRRRNTDSIGFQKCAIIDSYTEGDRHFVKIFPKTMKEPLRISRPFLKASAPTDDAAEPGLDKPDANLVDGLRVREDLRDPRISFSFGRYYLLIPETIPVPAKTEVQKVVALDPGVRKFQAFYSPQGEAGFIGRGGVESETHGSTTKRIGTGTYRQMDIHFRRISNLRRRMGQLEDFYGRLTDEERRRVKPWYKKKRYRLRRAWHRVNRKASDRMDDFHWKTVKWLLDNFDKVYIPNFAASRLSRRGGLARVTRKRLLYLKHFGFRQKLLYRALCRGKSVVVGNERETSKACGLCGRKNEVGSSEVFSCGFCPLRSADRDLHGARNFYLKCTSEGL